MAKKSMIARDVKRAKLKEKNRCWRYGSYV